MVPNLYLTGNAYTRLLVNPVYYNLNNLLQANKKVLFHFYLQTINYTYE